MHTKKNVIRALSALVIGLSLFAQSSAALAGPQHRVTIENNAYDTIYEVYASHPGWEWGPDRLGTRGVITSGNSREFDLDDGSGSCISDLKVVFRDGREVTRFGVNICRVTNWRVNNGSNRLIYVSR
jgi:hypothetical protein